MRYDEQFLETVRDSASIVELIGGYVQLKKRGKDWAALCPFHHEKTPSFWVSESKRIFKCFGCGAGGDVFKFLMLMENLSFTESIARLAERQGIPLPKRTGPPSQEDENRAALLKIMQLACDFFRDNLRAHKTAAEARDYLDRRGITAETIDAFGLGYAPGGSELLPFLKASGVGSAEALSCGLAIETSPGQYRDKFRSRVMFPIRDLNGRVIAFGGRALGDVVPKYLNSPETALYHKGSNLYGLDKARERIRKVDFAILVEGYFDCIAPVQYGFANTVASLGTSLTESQVKLLGRYTRNVVISFDPDSAGLSAALRSTDLFLEQGFRVNVLTLPQGHDPDTFVREKGAPAYEEQLKVSKPFIDFALSRFMEQKRDPFTPRAKQETVSQILPYLLKIADRIERAEYVSMVATRLKVDEQLIRAEMRRATGKPGPVRKEPALAMDGLLLAERMLLAAALDEEWAGFCVPLLEKELFEGLASAAIFEKVVDLRQQNRRIDILTLRKLLGEGDCLNLLDAVAANASQYPLSEEEIRGSILALEQRRIEREALARQEAIVSEKADDLNSPRLRQSIKEKEELRRKQQIQT